MLKRLISVGLCGVMLTGLTGCGSMLNISSIPLVPELSAKELIDYYKESLAYDTIATRTVKTNEVTYEMTPVSDVTKKSLEEMVSVIEGLLSRDSVSYADGMPTNIHQYIKYVIDDKKLTKVGITGANEALGHYFVDVEYKISPRASGSFTENLQYLGINGGFISDAEGNYVGVDSVFMNDAAQWVTAYLAKHPEYSNPSSSIAGIRRPMRNVALYNQVAGMSVTQSAMMPPLNQVYNIPAADGLSGYGIYPQGSFSLSNFGFNRSETTGTLTLRYVFKQELMDPTKAYFTNVYVTDYSLDNAPDVNESTVVPEFVGTEIAKILERSDRAIANIDLNGLMNGNIYEDVGVAVLYGNMSNYCNKAKHMSKVVDIVGRADHQYLASFETTTQEGALDTSLGTYVYTGYMVVQQVDTEFHITDYVITDWKMVKEPQINTDNTILKRLAALNLTGEVTDESKEGIKELMNALYTASTERKLDAMYACFDTDTSLLPETRREYLNAQLRSLLVQHGTNVPATYTGTVSEWVGGASNQVEFFTEELIEYPTLNKGIYMSNYYLVSSYADKWVIDEMAIVESKDVAGEELEVIKKAIAEGRTLTIDGTESGLVGDGTSQEGETESLQEVETAPEQVEEKPQDTEVSNRDASWE